MRSLLALLVLLAAQTAAAQPVTFQIKADVPQGKKPLMRLQASEPVRDIRIDLERSDGKRFVSRHPKLARGETVTLPIGDGAAGVARYRGTLSLRRNAGNRFTHDLAFETRVHAPLKVRYDLDHLDLDARTLQFNPSRPVARAELVVIGEDGTELATATATYRNAAPNTWLPITWTQRRPGRVMTLRLRVVAADGTATRLELIPWSVTIDHEDVNFATDSAVIEPTEHAKLDASLVRIRQIERRTRRVMPLKLYIAGHTDTVGPAAKNRTLSLRRAQAIATYFRQQGLTIPIAIAGFGEHILEVDTPDNTDHPANRRADYVLGPATGSPPFKGPYRRTNARWMQVR